MQRTQLCFNCASPLYSVNDICFLCIGAKYFNTVRSGLMRQCQQKHQSTSTATVTISIAPFKYLFVFVYKPHTIFSNRIYSKFIFDACSGKEWNGFASQKRNVTCFAYRLWSFHDVSVTYVLGGDRIKNRRDGFDNCIYDWRKWLALKKVEKKWVLFTYLNMINE